jgi:hypothetical protein
MATASSKCSTGLPAVHLEKYVSPLCESRYADDLLDPRLENGRSVAPTQHRPSVTELLMRQAGIRRVARYMYMECQDIQLPIMELTVAQARAQAQAPVQAQAQAQAPVTTANMPCKSTWLFWS